MTAILGISAFYHDSAAALLVDGEIVAAVQEERHSRKKHDEGFPVQAIRSCLERGGLTPDRLDYVGFYDKPYLKFERLLESYLAYAPRGFKSFAKAMPVWLNQKLWLPREMRKGLDGRYQGAFVFTEHHESHAAGAFFPSPFEESAILTMDGVGEWATASWGVGRGNRIQLSHELRFPHSLGLLYTAFTYYTGFKVNSDEYKLMGLAPYGEPVYADLILERLIDLKPDGSFRLDMSCFDYAAGLTMTNERFHALFDGPPREPESEITQRDMDIAASIQKVTEEIVLRSGRHVHAQTGMTNLCLSGGVALNCVANGRLLREGPFENIWIQPAAGDAGSALGVALFTWHQLLDEPRTTRPSDSQRGSLLGTEYSDEEIEAFLASTNATWTRLDDDDALTEHVADQLADGKVVGWYQGRMEFGPRALGSRSILGDPRRPDMQSLINRKVKFREGFRPFAPAVLREHVDDYFAFGASQESPYMLVVCPVQESRRRPVSDAETRAQGLDKLRVDRSEIPAVTHVDFSARIQTVDAERHGLYRRLIEAFHRKTGCPIVINTSFNLGWEPIVNTPREAYATFMSSDIDVLCMGHFLITKSDQKSWVSVAEPERPQALLQDLLASPCCGNEMRVDARGFACADCGQPFPVEEGIPRLYWPHEAIADDADVTDSVKAFYEETPFPNYQDHESVRSLIEKSRRGGYGHDLQQAIPFNSDVLEVGCGTGQLANFLGVSCRRVVGSDLCLNSLRLGEEFRRDHSLDRIGFVQMNLFRPAFKPESFDVVLCNGVLHHTSDPFGGYRGLVPLLRPGGTLVIGLYNRWGRLMTDLRRQIFRATGGRGRWLDPYLRGARLSRDKERAWFADQYRHPHESKHTMGEVLDWFDRTDVSFVRGVPSLTPGGGLADAGLFAPESPGSRFDRLLVQGAQIWRGSKEGGFFLMIGRKE
ncbi:MAG: methyltransferase domain-containing protein [Myxococcales bacterium]|nr:methyltransferase domain-containing protein [Myxococcales bacterium]